MARAPFSRPDVHVDVDQTVSFPPWSEWHWNHISWVQNYSPLNRLLVGCWTPDTAKSSQVWDRHISLPPYSPTRNKVQRSGGCPHDYPRKCTFLKGSKSFCSEKTSDSVVCFLPRKNIWSTDDPPPLQQHKTPPPFPQKSQRENRSLMWMNKPSHFHSTCLVRFERLTLAKSEWSSRVKKQDN